MLRKDIQEEFKSFIDKKMMDEERISQLKKLFDAKVNRFFADLLVEYMKNNLRDIETFFKENKIADDHFKQVCDAFFENIQKICFLEGYHSRFKEVPNKNSEFEVNKDDFKKFMDKKCSLSDGVEKFVWDTIYPNVEVKKELVKRISEIQKVINRYSGNKQSRVTIFNDECAKIINAIDKKTSYCEMFNETRERLNKALKDISTYEDNYYQSLIFSKFRQSNSTLKPIINNVQAMLNSLTIENLGQPKESNAVQRKSFAA
ncbi:MAG: hypothetical protein KIT56_02610 [Gammaproteobacteria bacterium]|nr:hypothetical protein [Gammaproteobacteria bacterium]MCW5582771.1 hypothetical protein [Gammaproteobacteria bacterium]